MKRALITGITGQDGSYLVEEAFVYVGLDWQDHVEIDPRYFRPTEVDFLQADASKARQKLAWEPRVTLKELVKIMVDADMEAVGLTARGEGRKILQEKFSGWHRWETGVTALYANERQGME